MSDDRTDARAQYLQRLGQEIERRRALQLNGLTEDNPHGKLLGILRAMGERLRSVPNPNYVERTKAERAASCASSRRGFASTSI
jgi:hypothetical protein